MRIPPLTTALALFAFTLAHPAAAGGEQDMNAFFNSAYSYCDARTLAAVWGVEISEAKARIGAQLSGGPSSPRVDAELQRARKKARGGKRVACEYWETKYTFEDAEVLAGAWGLSLEEAKARIGREVSLGRGAALDKKLRSLGRAPGQPVEPPPVSEQAALDAFWNSGLGYCDAELLGALWGADVFMVKVSMGMKILGGDQALLDSELVRAREAARTGGPRCEFWGTPYTPEDASALASFWGVGVDEAKGRMAAEYTAGGRAAVDSQLAAARGAR